MHTNLRRVSFMGGWVFNSEHLIGFVKSHVRTIQSLLFEGPSLNSEDPRSWSSVIREIATATKGTLKYLFIDTPMYWEDDWYMFADMSPEDLGEFDCAVDFYDKMGDKIQPLKPEDVQIKNGSIEDENTKDD
jgi:hypothetical protein